MKEKEKELENAQAYYNNVDYNIKYLNYERYQTCYDWGTNENYNKKDNANKQKFGNKKRKACEKWSKKRLHKKSNGKSRSLRTQKYSIVKI